MTPVDMTGWRAMDEKPPLLRPRVLIVCEEAQVVAEFLDEADRDEALHRCLTWDEVVEALALAPDIGEYFNGPHLRIKDFAEAYESWIEDSKAALAKARTRG